MTVRTPQGTLEEDMKNTQMQTRHGLRMSGPDLIVRGNHWSA